ncbi:phosphodiester glycosidase family protein [Streptomyces sodiiphilus]|uniref:Phosphodiester glycosidase family protein n=1 Tax=Streptomyces sodiiphilus TaxID=226217 RepID=A0ABN2P2P8_9ACTN
MQIPSPRRAPAVAGAVAACVLAVSLATAVTGRAADGRARAAEGAVPGAAAVHRAQEADALSGRLPLGPPGLEETRTVREIAPGLTHVAIERGRASADDFWTVTVGVATTEGDAAELEEAVRAAGYEPRRDHTAGPDPADPDGPPLGWLVRTGRYPDEAAARTVRNDLAVRVPAARVHATAEDGNGTSGPWSLDILVVDPGLFEGSIGSRLARGTVSGRETTGSIAARAGALAAVNGGYFVVGDAPPVPGPRAAGTEGDPGGIAVIRGDLVSEAVDGRPALLVPDGPGRGASVRRLRTEITAVASGGARREVTGLNRQAGLVLNCGGVGNARPFTRPAHDYTCGNDDELIAVTPVFGDTAPQGPGHQVTLDSAGRVTGVRQERGGPVPPDGVLLQGTGAGAVWLRENAVAGAAVRLESSVLDAELGVQPARIGRSSVVNGGPLLLRDGLVVLDPVRDGWSPEAIEGHDRAAFYNGWYQRRNPRTAAGVTEDGRIILLTADGRRPGHSVGLSIPETAEVMRGLGAVDAVNLDGGGSTAMVVHGELQGLPGDPAGERPVGDALVLLPDGGG